MFEFIKRQYADPSSAILSRLDAISKKLDHMEKHMSEITDAVDALDAAMTKNNAEIDTLLTKITAPTTTDAEVAAAAARIRTLTGANAAEVAKAQAAAP